MDSTEVLLKTPLTDWHTVHGGRMVEYAGWSMPVQYTSIIDEHLATRNAVGMFDVSHMGRFIFVGPDAERFIDGLTTRRIEKMKVGQIRYSLMTNDGGCILDDILVYRLPRYKEGEFFAMVVNAGNRNKIKDWILKHQRSYDIGFEDRTFESGMFAVQGPAALPLVAKHCECDPAQLAYYTGCRTELFGTEVMISRTGYTGEDGCEVVAPDEDIESIWQQLYEAGATQGLKTAGLGVRDTLRLEAGMPLYGHELSEGINAAQTGLGFAISTKNREFIGRDAIVAARAKALPQRVGLELSGRRPVRRLRDLLGLTVDWTRDQRYVFTNAATSHFNGIH